MSPSTKQMLQRQYPDRRELRAALKWFRQQHPECTPCRPIHHGFCGWCLWSYGGCAATGWESGYVADVMDVVEEYRASQRRGGSWA